MSRKKKIGILTFHSAHNYGAVLQAYALQEHLVENGFTVEIIDYRPAFIEKSYKLFRLSRIKSKNPITIIRKLIQELLLIEKRKLAKKDYELFLKTHLTLSPNIAKNREQIPTDYDLYIHGSDQIWNPKMLGGKIDPIYFGDFRASNGKKISYAASFANEPLKQQDKEIYKKLLTNLDAVSVREKELGILIKDCTAKKIYDVLDPTLLANPKVWAKIIEEPAIENYILIYQVGQNPLTHKLANEIARKNNLIIYDIDSEKNHVSVGKFVGLFLKADYIITTSFHGTAFSLIFNKQFYSIASGTGRDVRVDSLLKDLKIQERLLYKIPESITTIDYDYVNKNLEILKQKSVDFLKNNLCFQ